jgi:sugar phosphate isomerase/epimerase
MHDSMSRRRFLQASGAAALGAAAFQSLPAHADDKKEDFGGFTLGVQSYTYRNFDLEPALAKIQDLGLHYVELYQKHAPLESKPEQIKLILKKCSDYGIKPVCWGVQHFSKNAEANKRVFEFGQALGLKAFSADPDPDSFDSLDKLCENYKIAIAIHPHGPGGGGKLHRWYSAEVIMKGVKDHNPLIGAGLDTGHLIRAAQAGEKLDPAQQVRAMGARNFGMHMKDHDNKQKEDVVFGKGALDVAAVLKALREVKFTGHIAIEHEAHADNPQPDMKGNVEAFKEAVKKL